jgi:hypothetical protein
MPVSPRYNKYMRKFAKMSLIITPHDVIIDFGVTSVVTTRRSNCLHQRSFVGVVNIVTLKREFTGKCLININYPLFKYELSI